MIAELFEKKPIKQRYSFEVLCDFVHDKAKRLFNKYENAVNDKKARHDGNQYQRKVQHLESDLTNMQEVSNILTKIVVPTVQSILNRGLQDEQKSLSAPFIKQLMADLEYYVKK